jgi:hypothetical protein
VRTSSRLSRRDAAAPGCVCSSPAASCSRRHSASFASAKPVGFVEDAPDAGPPAGLATRSPNGQSTWHPSRSVFSSMSSVIVANRVCKRVCEGTHGSDVGDLGGAEGHGAPRLSEPCPSLNTGRSGSARRVPARPTPRPCAVQAIWQKTPLDIEGGGILPFDRAKCGGESHGG